MNPLASIAAAVRGVFASASGPHRRPEIDANRQSNIPGLYVIGDLAGAPVIKLAMAQGVEVIDSIAKTLSPGGPGADLDILIVGAGAAGLNAALAAKERGYRVAVLEKEKIANTIENFPEGKWVYAEPDTSPPKGKLWLDGAQKEDLVARWNAIVRENALDVRTEEPLTGLARDRDGVFTAKTPKGSYRARRIVLATGQRGNPRKLRVAGEDRETVYHRLYSPRKYTGEKILVVGGGNSAVEAALTLSEQNSVVLSYRGAEFARLFKDNERKLRDAIDAGRITAMLGSNVIAFGDNEASLVVKNAAGAEERLSIPFDHAFVLIGADLPIEFLRSLGLRMENDWAGSLPRAAALAFAALAGLWILGGHSPFAASIPQIAGGLLAAAAAALLVRTGARGDKFSWLALSMLVVYTVYGVKVGKGEEFWPFRDWGYGALSFFERPWAFWYNILYAVVMTIFGLKALKRWGLDRKDTFQTWRYVTLISVQWIIAVIVPEILFQWALKYQWVGAELATNPQFRDQGWRVYGIVYAWPLFFYTFLYDPHWIWVVWGIVLTFLILPMFAIWHGKRYCSWICGCGGLAETLGDQWRHLAPKGKNSIRWEWMQNAVLIGAFLVTAAYLVRDLVPGLRAPAEGSVRTYRLLVDVWLVGIIPVTLYPFLGGKVWCRYWCPLAKLMHYFSKFHAKIGTGKFGIEANDKCIGCYECSRNCQVGIDVMSYALKQERLDNATSSCIGCGICVTVCPMDTLHFSTESTGEAARSRAASVAQVALPMPTALRAGTSQPKRR
ncbi:MAG: FAD-dependent oxidoreductase [bacterium]